jgi:serine/threonine-protein kinase
MTQPVSLEPRISHLGPATGGGGAALPLDLVEDAARRLRALCLVLAAVVVLNEVARLAFRGAFLPEVTRWGQNVFALGASGIVYWLSHRLPPRRVIDAGLVYAVVIAAILAANAVPANWFGTVTVGYGWSPNAVWVLVFPVMIPSTLRRMILVATLAAAAEPIAIVAYAAGGLGPLPSAGEAASRLWPNAIAVAVALVTTRVIHRLGEKIQAARSVGNYHLVRQLGEGGMGQVWEATHRMLARPAAVKLISPAALGEHPTTARKLFLRFEREAQATAQLQSPHTIGVYDFGVARDGSFYYVMELLDGLDLHSLVDQYGPQPPERVAHILIQVCHSLAEAHDRGLIHRDIKPANLYLCRYGLDTDFMKVLDFGLVKPRESEAEPRPDLRITQHQTITGTPGFIAPEAMGDGPLDGRADLYAVGCVAYWMLTGREVFEQAALMAMLVAHAQQTPRPPSELVPEIPRDLERVVLDLLEKEPARRPQTAQLLAERLAALGLADRWTEERRRSFWEGRPARVLMPPPSVTTARTLPV